VPLRAVAVLQRSIGLGSMVDFGVVLLGAEVFEIDAPH
jgi:hypothetical protein